MEPSSRYPEGIIDVRIYRPKVGLHPNKKQAKYIGKSVHVVWQQPIFNFVGGMGHQTDFWVLAQWFAYVIEFDKQIPQEDLLRPPRLQAPKESK